ncbi:hypothetical protein P775_12260 [Puniceibacterium antarcticum]|uniref:DUF1127 domain-containing protein n=1 Tax=Puniceibacterium antarcticum TaxID=1206336 RepID=A0A2G8RE56_9RHOB|nr:hypothetical protein [Puniceibacterium antarcticum]PIL19845.1 hypothetical protein P775_12260 [Puniceibacterium antarcticum]
MSVQDLDPLFPQRRRASLWHRLTGWARRRRDCARLEQLRRSPHLAEDIGLLPLPQRPASHLRLEQERRSLW